MKKTYVVKFTEASGDSYEFEFLTENIEKSIREYCRNRSIAEYKILNENTGNRKQMLFG